MMKRCFINKCQNESQNQKKAWLLPWRRSSDSAHCNVYAENTLSGSHRLYITTDYTWFMITGPHHRHHHIFLEARVTKLLQGPNWYSSANKRYFFAQFSLFCRSDYNIHRFCSWMTVVIRVNGRRQLGRGLLCNYCVSALSLHGTNSDTAVSQWRTRLHACIKAKGGYFEGWTQQVLINS